MNFDKNETDVIFIFGLLMLCDVFLSDFLQQPQSQPDYQFASSLETWLTAHQGRFKKSQRTALSLQIAGCKLLTQESLSQLTISKLCKEAGIAQGTFYLHFQDLHDFISKLLMAFIAFLQLQMKQAAQQSEVDSIRASTATYYALFEANLGLMKCLLHHLEDFPESRSAFLTLNREWTEHITHATLNRWRNKGKEACFSAQEIQRRAYALGGLVDQYLNMLLLHKDPTLTSLSSDREAVIDSICDIWKRGLAL